MKNKQVSWSCHLPCSGFNAGGFYTRCLIYNFLDFKVYLNCQKVVAVYSYEIYCFLHLYIQGINQCRCFLHMFFTIFKKYNIIIGSKFIFFITETSLDFLHSN